MQPPVSNKLTEKEKFLISAVHNYESIPHQQQRKFRKALKEQTFFAGTKLISEGSPANYCFLIKEGDVKVIKTTNPKNIKIRDDGSIQDLPKKITNGRIIMQNGYRSPTTEKFQLGTKGPKSWVGEDQIVLRNEVFQYTVFAKCKVVVYYITKDDFLQKTTQKFIDHMKNQAMKRIIFFQQRMKEIHLTLHNLEDIDNIRIKQDPIYKTIESTFLDSQVDKKQEGSQSTGRSQIQLQKQMTGASTIRQKYLHKQQQQLSSQASFDNPENSERTSKNNQSLPIIQIQNQRSASVINSSTYTPRLIQEDVTSVQQQDDKSQINEADQQVQGPQFKTLDERGVSQTSKSSLPPQRLNVNSLQQLNANRADYKDKLLKRRYGPLVKSRIVNNASEASFYTIGDYGTRKQLQSSKKISKSSNIDFGSKDMIALHNSQTIQILGINGQSPKRLVPMYKKRDKADDTLLQKESTLQTPYQNSQSNLMTTFNDRDETFQPNLSQHTISLPQLNQPFSASKEPEAKKSQRGSTFDVYSNRNPVNSPYRKTSLNPGNEANSGLMNQNSLSSTSLFTLSTFNKQSLIAKLQTKENSKIQFEDSLKKKADKIYDGFTLAGDRKVRSIKLKSVSQDQTDV